MKITLFEKTKEMFQNKFRLKRPSLQEEIMASYFVNIKEAYTNTTYYYVRTQDGKEALYLYPGYKLLAGEEFLSKQEIESLPKKTYQSKQEHIRHEITERLFYNLLGEYKQNRLYRHSKNKYSDGFSYLTSLYYEEDQNYLEAFNKLYKDLKRECDNLGINYETDPEVIMERRLNEAHQDSEFKTIDIRVCKSKSSIDEYYKNHLTHQTDSNRFSHELRDFQYIKTSYVMNYNGEFLSHSDNLIDALLDRNYPNREEILKKYMEFFITKDISFELVKYLEELISKADEIQYNMEQERYNSNFKFMEDLEAMVKHNKEEETYRYHATTSIEDAERILEEGFYSYSKDLDSTSFPEFNIKQILSYSYGSGIEQFGDYIVVLSEPKDEEIIRELTEEEQDKVTIIPRRNAIIGNKPPYIVDKKHVVGIIDKKHEKVILNSEYVNNSKKQINI